MIKAKIVADSVNSAGERITTFELEYPRFIHSEVMTHRAFARNAASSRAIPVAKMIERIKTETAMPITWGKNQKGMQADTDVNATISNLAEQAWCEARDRAIESAQKLIALGIHKQIANRVLEPFAHMLTLVTATDYGNFFNLRAHKDAQPEFQRLAYLMLKRLVNHVPTRLPILGAWHLPYADKFVADGLSTVQLLKITTARAARTSYMNQDGVINHEKDYELHDSLAASGHWSPFEHAAQATPGIRSGSFKGWAPYRKHFLKENQETFDGPAILAACPFGDWLEVQ